MTTKRSPVEGELYQMTKHLHRVSDDTLDRVVAGEPLDAGGGPRADIAFPPEGGDELR